VTAERDEGVLSTYETILDDVVARYATSVAYIARMDPPALGDCSKFIQRDLPARFERIVREEMAKRAV
jgi:hypothetical protein